MFLPAAKLNVLIFATVTQKLKHGHFQKTTYLTAPGQTVLAFMQYQDVSYTFTVVPVEVLDTYVIEVEATFETHVPKPVVVVSSVKEISFHTICPGHTNCFRYFAVGASTP